MYGQQVTHYSSNSYHSLVEPRSENDMAKTDNIIKKLNLPVEGMTCAACVGFVESALESVPGVMEATVHLCAG